MRIVLFNYFGSKPNPVYDILATSLHNRGHEVFVGTVDTSGDFVWRAADGKVIAVMPIDSAPEWIKSLPVFPALYDRWSRLKTILAARSMLRKWQPDILQVNTISWPWLLAIAMPSNMHVAYDIRQINEAVNTKLRSRIREKMNAFSWRFWSQNAFEHTFFCHAEAAKRILGENWARFASVIPVGIDDHFLALKDCALHNISDEDPVRFVYVGSLSRLRTLEKLFYAANQLRNDTEDFHMTVAGPDQSGGYFQGVLDQLDLNEFVTMLPPLNYAQIPEFLAQFDVGLAYVPDRPTWHYQPTIKIFEYRALGLPILSTDVLSHREIIQDGVNGVMVSDSHESIANGMRRLVTDRPFLRDVSARARKMRTGLTWDGVAKMYEDAYFQLLHRSAATEILTKTESSRNVEQQ